MEGIVTAKKSADTPKADAGDPQVPVGSVQITSYHDFPDFEQSVPEIEYGYNLPVDVVPESVRDE